MRYGWTEAMVEYLGLWVLIALAVNMWALISVVGAPASLLTKALWTVVLLIPAIGFVFWYMLGPRRTAS